jgi:CubicO group peptidase (beta-lactamase class C family)
LIFFVWAIFAEENLVNTGVNMPFGVRLQHKFIIEKTTSKKGTIFMIIRAICYLLMFLSTFGQILCAQEETSESKRTSQIRELLNSYSDLEQFSGAVLVAEKGKVVYRGGHGSVNRELDVPTTAENRFIIGSMTKAFTAVLVMQAVEAGKLELDKSVRDYWPEFNDPSDGKITIRQLLTHQSGLKHWNGIEGFLGSQDRLEYAAEELANKFASIEMAFSPGDRFGYSSPGYYILGIVLTKVWNKEFSELLNEGIFEPLEMNSSSLHDYATTKPGRAAAYRYNFVKARYDNAEFRDPSTMFSTGGILTTVDDLLKWDQALLGEMLFSVKSKEIIFDPSNSRQAFGWHHGLPGRDSENIVWHGGLVTGYRSQITRSLDSHRTVILLGNLRDINTNEITSGILAILDGDKPVPPRQSLMKAVLEVVAEHNAATAVERFDAIRKSKDNDFNTDPTELLRAAMELKSDEELASAAVLYEHWLKSYPTSPYRDMAVRDHAECNRLLKQK